MEPPGDIAGMGAVVTVLTENEKLKKSILGEYSDGSTRSLKDCIDGEFLSPKQKEKINKKKSDKKKKKKKKSKNKNKFASVKF